MAWGGNEQERPPAWPGEESERALLSFPPSDKDPVSATARHHAAHQCHCTPSTDLRAFEAFRRD